MSLVKAVCTDLLNASLLLNAAEFLCRIAAERLRREIEATREGITARAAELEDMLGSLHNRHARADEEIEAAAAGLRASEEAVAAAAARLAELEEQREEARVMLQQAEREKEEGGWQISVRDVEAQL